MKKNCGCCDNPFVVSDDDIAFYEKLSVPAPEWCPECREMRRMSWCNEGILYMRSCDMCSKKVVSQFSPENPRKTYCIHCWWGDKWEALDFGREVNLNRSFMEQFQELLLAVPHAHTNTDLANENSEYTHHAGHEKNCYMMFHCSFAEDCYYGYGVKKAKDCVDNHYCHESELCFECIDVHHCYDLAWCQDCGECSSSRFLLDCVGCKNCFLCTGLRNKEYHFLNQKLSRAEYQQRVAEINLGSWSTVQGLLKQFTEMKKAHGYKNLQMNMVENCLGNHLYQARESQYCFDCSNVEFSKYCSQLQLGTRYCHDIYQFGIEIELCYDCAMIGYNIYNCQFCYDLLQQCRDLQYCISCHSTKDSFGCVGLKQKQYCILNRQYRREEYEALREQIIAKMLADGEYGAFFPVQMSPHGYNETMAVTWYPRTKEEVQAQGWYWEEQLPFSKGKATRRDIPEDIAKVDEGILGEVLSCESCARDYKIIAQELAFYSRQKYPLPRQCFQCRRTRRANQRDPRQIWLRNCINCQADIPTTISPQRPEKVYCEKCYLERVY